jgi:hypothetical protein
VRIIGRWPELGKLPPAVGAGGDGPAALDGGPAAVLTLGHLRLRRAVGFARASAKAERDAVTNPAAVIATGLARPPRFVGTFSVWREVAAMREYAAGTGGGHLAAAREHAANPFHHASAFVRFRPYDEHGSWVRP